MLGLTMWLAAAIAAVVVPYFSAIRYRFSPGWTTWVIVWPLPGSWMTRDDSVIWEHHTPGMVTDVAMTAKGAAVNVKTESPVQVGDKLVYSKRETGRHTTPEELKPLIQAAL